MNRQASAYTLRHLTRLLTRKAARRSVLAILLLLICSQQLLLAHAVEHEHSGANVTLCLLCAAADITYVPASGPALPAPDRVALHEYQAVIPTPVVSTPDSTALPRAPPSHD
jgi:hypothetical protein